MSLGTFLTYTFGAEQGWGWGLEARGGGTRENFEDQQCGVERPAFFYGAGALRLEWFPSSHTRLLALGLAGHTFASSDASAHGELGLGYRFGEHAGLDSVLGAELDASVAMLALHYEPLRAELSPALGLFFPAVTMPAARGCWVAGRPRRCETGIAPLPVLARSGCSARARDTATPREVARIWARRAQTELASVPAFHELAVQLRVLNAPAELVARARASAEDELRHALIAVGHVASFDGGALALASEMGAPRASLAGTAGFVRTALESWVDGCLGEGVAAACAAEEARVAVPSELRRTQQVVAEDEQRHGELAWDVLAWALDAGGADVRRALHAAAEAEVERTPESTHEEPLEAFGVLSSERQRDLADVHHARSLERLSRLLAG